MTPWKALLVAGLCAGWAWGRRGVHPDLKGGDPSNPGMKVRLTQRGLNYMATLSGNVMEQVLPIVKLPPVTRVLPNNQGTVTITDMVVRDFKLPDVMAMRLLPPQTVRWTLRGMDMAILGRINGKVMGLPVNGDLTFNTKGIDFQLELQVAETAEGSPSVQSTSCTSSIRNVDIKIDNGGLVGILLGVFKGMAVNKIKPELTKELCTEMQNIINTQFKKILEDIPTRFPIVSAETFEIFKGQVGSLDLGSGSGKGKGKGKRRRSLGAGMSGVNLFDFSGKGQKKSLTGKEAGLWLDFRLLERPSVLPQMIEMSNRGEVSWGARGGTPFHPPSVSERGFSPNRMLYLLASDYTLNSLMYHAYRNGLLRFELTPESPGVGEFLRTTCDDLDTMGELGMCMGDLIEGLPDAHPDRELEMLFYPIRSPAFFFRADERADVDVKGVLFVFVRGLRPGKKKVVMAAQIDVSADAELEMRNGTLVGSVSINRFDILLRRSNVPGLDSEAMEELGPLAGDIVQMLTNGMLGDGLPMPALAGARLINPRMRLMDRLARLETDLAIHPQDIVRFTKDAIESGNMG